MLKGTFKRITGFENGIRVDGIQQITKELEGYLEAFKISGHTSMKRMMIKLYSDMDKQYPKIPVDTGNLRASWFTKFVRSGQSVGVIFGFKANYALYVHEMVGADFTSPRWRYDKVRAPGIKGLFGKKVSRRRWYVPREGAGAKFMETHLKNNYWTFLNYLEGEMRRAVKKGHKYW